MSGLATAYIVPTLLLAELGSFSHEDQFWAALREGAICIEPSFDDSDEVMVILFSVFEEAGIDISAYDNQPAIQAIQCDVNLWLGVGYSEAADLLSNLHRLDCSEEEWRRYFEKITGDDWKESGAPLKAAYEFVMNALRQIHHRDQWLLMFVG